ncbi:SRPBCC family protein [Muriicola sp.]|uniref:SRPBCC family protein n=1 Tax=Muriicola sp. TaxID=2020856 RepID=UPI003C7443E2
MKQPQQTKQIGCEYITEDEDSIIEEMMSEMIAQVDRMYADKKMLRQIHTKMHGCVKATFKVEGNLPDDLKVGVFKNPTSYNAWVRFSNSNTKPQKDKKKDIRGIAIKLMGVPGEKILNDQRTEKSQDFLLMTSETFFSKNIAEFRKTLKASTAKSKIKLALYFLNPTHWGILKRVMRSMVKCSNPLDMQYWSTQPYQYGAPDKAVKYYLKPSPDNVILNENTKEENYLSINMAQTLYSNPAEFDFYVQFQTDAETMPIEDPTVEWTSQFFKVATLTIVAQEFDATEQMTFGENLSFNSWHSLPEHRPLGSFNRARRRVYEAMSRYRHEKNGLPVFEPKNSADFLPPKREQNLETIPEPVPKKGILKRSAQVLVDCDRSTAFDFITSNSELPNWLKKVGPIPAALNAEILKGPYNFVGARRKVFFDGGDTVVEELMTFNPSANYSYSVTEFSDFLRFFTKKAYGQVWFDRINDQTRITWDYSFSYRNILARLILSLFLSLLYKKFLKKSLENAKGYIENGD